MLILILIMAIVLSFFAKIINNVLKVPKIITYLIFGMLFGESNIFGSLINLNLFGNEIMQQYLNAYNGKIALIILFVSAGIGLNLGQIKNNKKKVIQLSFYPSYSEGIIIGIVLFILTLIIPGEFNRNLSLIDAVIVMLFLSMSTGAVILPITKKNISTKNISINKINPLMESVSFIDLYTSFFLIIILSIISRQIHLNVAITIFTIGLIIKIIVLIIFSSLIACISGIIISKIISKIVFNPNIKAMIVVGLAIIITMILSNLDYAINGLNAFLFGIGYNNFYNKNDKDDISIRLNKYLDYFGFPIIFITLGATIVITKLFSLEILVISTITMCGGILIKGLVGIYFLKKDNYTKQEKKFLFYSFMAKGNGAVNFGILMLGGIFINSNMGVIVDLLTYLAIIDILITIPISSIMLEKIKFT